MNPLQAPTSTEKPGGETWPAIPQLQEFGDDVSPVAERHAMTVHQVEDVPALAATPRCYRGGYVIYLPHFHYTAGNIVIDRSWTARGDNPDSTREPSVTQ